jgi:hypothetical protein
MLTKRPPAKFITYAQWRARKAERLKQQHVRTINFAKDFTPQVIATARQSASLVLSESGRKHRTCP